MHDMKQAASLIIFLALGLCTVHAEDWPGWRGPRGDGSSSETGAPTHWSNTDNVAWKAAIPGIGHSSPIIHGDRIFLTSCLQKEEERILLCLDRRDGKILWQQSVLKAVLEKKRKLNSFSSSTPATDGKHVYVAFLQVRPRSALDDYPRKPRDVAYLPKDLVSEMVVACYTAEGKLAWRKSPGQFYSRHGFCSSPILYKDLVIINGDQDAEAYIVALDKNTGEERWRIDRPNRTRSYCAPLIAYAAGKQQLVLSGSKCVTSYDPDTGKPHWIIDGPTEQYVASLVYADDVFFLTAGFPEYHNMGIRPDGNGNVTRTHVLWHEKNTPARKASYVPSPIAYDKYFYVVSDLGFVGCFEARTGNRLWMEQLGRHHSASPVLADGHLYFSDDDGITYVLKAGRDFQVVARNTLGEECYASPAISRGQIFLRTLGHLYCIGRGKQK
jgi:outer membrane protein assembly factor BamB